MRKKRRIGQEIIEGLTQAIAHARGEITLRTTDLEIPPEPKMYTKEEIRALRLKLKYSQGVMAAYMGVEDQTIRSWEKGTKSPSGTARRLLEILSARPTVLEETMSTRKRR
jgi:putative transcriptional regulator